MASRLTLGLAAVSLAALATGCRASAKTQGPARSASSGAASVGHVATYDVNRLDAAIHRYAADRAGRLPAGLSSLATERAPGGAPYLPTVPNDPWGAPYAYAVLDARLGTYDLRSYGPDRLPGTDDDVVARADPVSFD